LLPWNIKIRDLKKCFTLVGSKYRYTLKLTKSKLAVFRIFAHLPLLNLAVPFSQFLTDFQKFRLHVISQTFTNFYDFLITGEFYIHINDAHFSHTKQFLSSLDFSIITTLNLSLFLLIAEVVINWISSLLV
jgi:hypothetical protein